MGDNTSALEGDIFARVPLEQSLPLLLKSLLFPSQNGVSVEQWRFGRRCAPPQGRFHGRKLGGEQ
jgi:hypothetical protein